MKTKTDPATEWDLTDLMTPTEAATAFRVTRESVANWADQGLLDCMRTARGHRRYSRQQITALMGGHPTGRSTAGDHLYAAGLALKEMGNEQIPPRPIEEALTWLEVIGNAVMAIATAVASPELPDAGLPAEFLDVVLTRVKAETAAAVAPATAGTAQTTSPRQETQQPAPIIPPGADTPVTAREEQRAVAAALEVLLRPTNTDPLPLVEWSVSGFHRTGLRGPLNGPSESMEAVRADVDQWAAFLGADVKTYEHVSDSVGSVMATTGEFMGVSVHVWGSMPRPAIEEVVADISANRDPDAGADGTEDEGIYVNDPYVKDLAPEEEEDDDYELVAEAAVEGQAAEPEAVLP